MHAASKIFRIAINCLCGLILIRMIFLSATSIIEELSVTTDFAGIAGLLFGLIGMPLAAIANFSACFYPNKLWVAIINGVASVGATVLLVAMLFSDDSVLIPIILMCVYTGNAIVLGPKSNPKEVS